MSFDWYEYCKLAKGLIGQNFYANEEAKRRAAISRAYYYLFNIAESFVAAQGITFSGPNWHKQLRDHFKNQSDLISSEIADVLSRLWGNRVKADYENKVFAMTATTVDIAIREVESIISKINALLVAQSP